MANTTNQGWAKPTIGGSEDTWGQTVNDAIDAIDTLVGGVTAAEVAKLDGLTATTDELNYSAGVTSAIQPQLDAINAVPSGAIMLWSGAADAIPANYVLCDGANSTPDLRNRFVVGAGDTYATGDTGGSESVTLTEAQIPSHTHTFSGTTSSNGAHSFAARASAGGWDGAAAGNGGQRYTLGGSNHTHTFSGTTASAGSGSSHENRPPYYSLAYIMKT